MYKVAALLVLLQLSLFAATNNQKNTDRFTLYADSVTTENNNTVVAKGGVVIYHDDSIFSASEAKYDRKKGLLELRGEVFLFFKDQMINKCDFVLYDLKKGKFLAKNVFVQDANSDIWIKTKKLHTKKELYHLKSAALSSCPGDEPDWQIKFSSAYYHSDKEYVSMYNPRFYVGKVPVLYLPWIAFPTGHTRKSGLLRPVIGFENSENLMIMQPYFWAPSKSWDVQFNPQIRLNRGVGLYATLRFADSPYSKGSLTVGYFNEQSDYAASHNLKNSVHKGLEFDYVNYALFTKYIKENPYSYKDGLLIDITTLNDIDYINLKDDRKYAVDKLVTSKINYYMSGYQDYFGIYAKYFIDTEKVSNADTLQTLPSLQYHKFTQTFLNRNFLYSIDYKLINSYRRTGLRAKQHEFSLPVIFTLPLWNDYLNFSASENLYYSRVNYFDANESIDNANYFSNYHRISLSSDLMKRYPNFTHNLQTELSVIIPSFNDKRGYFAEFIPFNIEKKNVSLKVNNYLYNENGENFLIDRFVQRYYFKEEDKKYNEAENEIIYKYSKNLSLRNALVYSYEYHKLKKIQSGLRYKDDFYDLRLDHTYQDAPNETKINFFSGDFWRVIDRRYSLYGGIDYDLDNDFTKEWRLGLDMRKKCWSYQLRYKESVTPSLTSAGAESVIKRGIYLMVRFAHIGGVNYKYVKDISTKDLSETTLQPKEEDSFEKVEENPPLPVEDKGEENVVPSSENNGSLMIQRSRFE